MPVSRRRLPSVISVMALFVVVAIQIAGIYTYTRLDPSPANPFATQVAQAATNSNLNFQARILQASGAVVPDGAYNVEFKLYDAATSGTLLWTETWYDANGVTAGQDNRIVTKNGYITASLGSQTAFPAIDWDQELWISLNIGGTTQTATPTWDGEMNPRMKITAVPYAFKAAQAASVKTADTNAASTNSAAVTITSGNAAGATSNSGNITIDAGTATQTAGQLLFGTTNTSAITMGRAGVTTTLQGSVAVTGAGTALSVTNSATVGGTLIVTGLGTFNGGLTVGTGQLFTNSGATLNSATAISDRAAGGAIGTAAATVDVSSNFNVNQTTASQALTLPTPTSTTAGRVVYVNNVGTQTFSMYGFTIAPAGNASFMWNGTAWALVGNVGSSGAYIQNQNSVQQATSNFWISGTGRADTSFTTILLDTPTATTLNIGTTNATQINLNKNVVLAASQSLTVTGGNTASRPGSPTEGMVYYDTTTKQLLTYANGKWQADRKSATFIVAASDSTQTDKDAADYVTDGEDSSGSGIGTLDGDQIQINAALDAAEAAKGGIVYLLAGTYTVDAAIQVPNNVTLAGTGASTLIQLGNFGGTSVTMQAIANKDTSTGARVTVRDVRIDGRRSINTNGAQYGIYLNGMGGGNGASARDGAKITNVYIANMRSRGIHLNASSNNVITGNTWQNNVSSGIRLDSSSNNNTVTSNLSQGNATHGIYITSSSINNTVTSNTAQGNANSGIRIESSSNNNVINANKLYDNGSSDTNDSIYITGSDDNTIVGNSINDTSATTNNYAINIADNTSDKNYLADNRFNSTPGTSTINDAGTGTVYANQSRAEAGGQLTNRTANDAAAFAVQNASGTNQLVVDTTNSKVLVSGTIDTTTATTLAVGNTTATAITIGRSGITTTVSGALGVGSDLTVYTNTVLGDASSDRITINGQISGGSPFALQGATDNGFTTTLALVDPTANNVITFPNETGTVCTTGTVCAGYAAAPASGSYVKQVPATTADNTITPTANGVVGLTVNGTSGTAAIALSVVQSGAATGLAVTSSSTGNGQDINLTNTSGTQTDGLSITRNGAGGTTTNLLRIDNSAGTATNALTVTGTYSTGINLTGATTTLLVNATNFTVSQAGAVTAVGVNSGTGLIQGTGGSTISGATTSINASSNFATNINTGTSTGAVSIGNSAAGTIAIQSGNTIGLTGTTTITGRTTGDALTVNNSTSTGNVFVAQDNGSAVFTIADGGNVGIGNASPANKLNVNTPYTAVTGADLVVTATDANTIPLVVQAAATPNVNAFQVRSSAGAVQSGFTASGRLFVNTTAALNGVSITSSTGTSGTIGQVIQGVSGQSVDLFQLRDSDFYVHASFNATGNQLTLGRIAASNTVSQGKIVFADGTTDNYGLTLQSATLTGSQILTLPNLTGTLCVQGSSTCGTSAFTAIVGTSAAGGASSAIASVNYSNAAYVNTSTTSAQTMINSALSAMPATGGTVYLMEGTYVIDGSINIPNNVTLAGSGTGTIIKLKNSTNADIKMITNTDAINGTNITIRDLKIDGNLSNQSSGNQHGIYLDHLGDGSGAGVSPPAVYGGRVENLEVAATRNEAIYATTSGEIQFSNIFVHDANASGLVIYASHRNTVMGVISQNNNGTGIRLDSGSTGNSVSGNSVRTNSGTGIAVTGSSFNNAITANSLFENSSAIQINNSNNNTVTGNSINQPNLYGIQLNTANNNTVSGNKIYDSGSLTANNGIYLTAADANTITGNDITDSSATTNNYAINISNNTSNKNYLSNNRFSSTPATSSIYDFAGSSSDNVYVSQSMAEDGGQIVNRTANSTAAFAVQNASGTNQLVVDTTNGRVGINTNAPSADLTFGQGANRTINVETRTSNAAGRSLTVIAGSAGSGGSAFAGGALTLQGGSAAGTGNANGGNVALVGGTGTGTGVKGLVVLDTATYSTASTQTSATSVNVTQSNIDSFGAIVLNASAASVAFTLSDPTLGASAAGRVVYVTAASGSSDFTLRANVGEGTGIEQNIAMRQNTTATMIWSGTNWTAAGASSSTTLQAAYDNTLTAAGGAEIVLNNSASANGLTVRNNSSSPIIGGIFEAQTSIGSNLFSVNNNATEYASNGGAETAGASDSTFPANTWDATTTGGTVDRWTTAGDNIATGAASVRVQTTTTNHGARNRISAALTSGLTYSVSFAVRGATNFSTLQVLYSPDGTTSGTTQCSTAETVTSGIWTRISCTFVASGTITSSNSILIRQTDAAIARTFYIDNLSVNINASATYAADGSVDDAGNFATNWQDFDGGTGSTTESRDTTTLYDTSASAEGITTANPNQGLRNNMAITPSINTQYLVSFYAYSSNTVTSALAVGFLPAGGTSVPSGTAACTDYNTQSLVATTWTKITCLFTTTGTAISNPDLVIYQTDSTARTINIDALSITLNTNNANNVQIGGANKGGPTTLFTLDRSDSAPIAANNDAYLGSMYYDTTTGRIQCYEADGWGACGSAPDNIVNLNPEYAGAVLNGSGVGTMTADLCANGGGLSVNTGLCASGEAKNFYKWTSPQATQQTYSIYVSYQLPTTFKGFASDDTVQLTARVDSTSNAAVTYEMYRSESGALSQCGSGETAVTTSTNTWQTVGINGNESTGCSFTASSGGAYVIFKINVKANSNANAYVSTLSFTTTGK